jgi:CDP-diacylglycerol---glycerol-3-phosphate 3-phosphatidyltransferase
MNIPNSLTLARISLAPLLALAMLPEIEALFATTIFAVGMTTDVADGYLARSGGVITRFGEFMDPIADKLFVGTALVCLAATGRIAPWIVLVVFARDLFVTGLRFVARRRGIAVAANGLGKAKTVLQTVTVFVLLAVGGDAGPVQALVFLMVTATVVSGAVYAVSYLRAPRFQMAPVRAPRAGPAGLRLG